MKRRQLLQFLALPLFLASSCKEKLPDAPTIVTGKVIDENGLPLEGAGLSFYGVDNRGWSGIPTFDLTIETDKDGTYRFSSIVPKDTDDVRLFSITTSKVIIDNQNYEVYLLLEGQYQPEASPYSIPRSDWGKSTILNYQFRKR
ncbi:hypothetical protein [Dyadobacter tibetensis]|uniref:hypothetical protein n=1 Tax=Dyadobacter tibetensis TaxID=1211851 RepID=UPI000470339B|nr:hypothetical protein [Dyadobacter tibetensis]